MRATTFDKLVAPLRAETIDPEYTMGMTERLNSGGAVSPPYLLVDFQNRAGARVVGHEGRHRSLAIQGIDPNARILVHIFPTNGMRARHLTADTITRFRFKAFPQGKTRALAGPLFEPKVWFNSQWLDLEKDLEAPKRPDVGTPVLARVEKRMTVWLRRRGVPV